MRERKGSRARCLLLTDGDDVTVAERLAAIAAPYATIDALRHKWLPVGLAAPREAKLGEEASLLPSTMRDELISWWLAVPKGANTPNWDIASTCTIGGREGLLLVEAKAHSRELHVGGCGSTRSENQQSIASAMAEANDRLEKLSSGWHLHADSHFQVCNRFAFAWKLASQGVPVVLVYLGFLNAYEMADPLATHDDWRRLVLDHGHDLVPESVWDATLDVGGTSLTALIRSSDLRLD